MHHRLLYFLILLLWVIPQANAQTIASHGMVVSDHHLASETGVQILKKGGNAVDAAVATAFALAVTHPSAGNIGGGGFLVFMDTTGQVNTIDFREKAPMAATRDMFLDSKGHLIPGTNHKGLKTVGVPGTVAGLFLAHQRYGRMKWADLVQPAIDLAENGFEMSWGLYEEAKWFSQRDTSQDILQTYFHDQQNELVEPGEIWRQPELAQTLTYIRDQGHDGFYSGPVADEIERYMQAKGGLITREDLAAYNAVERSPVHGTYRGYDIYSMAPPSSGGVVLMEMLNMLEMADPANLDFGSSDYVHLVAEIMRRAYADRAQYLGDPDFNPEMPVDDLLSKEHAEKRFKSIDMKKASVTDPAKFGHPYGGDNTTHFSVIDKEGNAVSLTYTLEYSYGSGMGSEKLGFIFNNEMGDFNPVPGLTNEKGLIGTPANLIAPGKRMLSSMTPTIVARDGKPYLVIGSPGGRTIINTVFQTIVAVLDYGMPVDDAIEALKIHHQWLPDMIRYEKYKLPVDVRQNLEQKGHTLQEVGSLGKLMGIMVDRARDIYIGAADSSTKDGAACGY